MDLLLQRYSWAAGVLAAILGAYLAARAVNTFAASAIAPKPALLTQSGTNTHAAAAAAHVELDGEKTAKLFDVPLPKPVADDPNGPGNAPEPTKNWSPVPVHTQLHGTLVGTAIAEPRQYSLCEILNPDVNETSVYGVGEHYMGALIYQIDKKRVLLDNNGVNEYLDDNAGGAAPAPNLGVQPVPAPGASNDNDVKQLSPNQYVVSKNAINNALTNLSDLATKARIVPSFKNGVANGFKLFSIVPDSLYAKIGVQNGDVIHRINGYEMNSPDKALEIYQKLRDANRIEIEIERRGETMRNTYSIE
jgi:general secretion pathway protein C